MTAVTVIGAGQMGQAIAAIATRGGASVQMIGRDAERAAAAGGAGVIGGVVGDVLTGDVVVLAVPYPALAELGALYGVQLNGKVVVDLTNPVDFTTFDSLLVPADSSAAAELAAALPGAHVVKAFNTNIVDSLVDGQVNGMPTVVQMAGDDDAAKRMLADIITAGGLRAADVGSLARARELEAFGFLQIVLSVREAAA